MAFGWVLAFFFLARQYARPWFPAVPGLLSGWACRELLRPRCFKAVREKAVACGAALPVLAAWSPVAAIGLGLTGAMLALAMSDGKRAGAAAARRAVFCVLAVATGCSGLAMLGHGEALIGATVAAWTACTCLSFTSTWTGFWISMGAGWVACFGMMAAECAEAPGTIDPLMAGIWAVGVAGAAVVGSVGAQYVLGASGTRSPEWYMKPLLAGMLSAPGAAALLQAIPVFVG